MVSNNLLVGISLRIPPETLLLLTDVELVGWETVLLLRASAVWTDGNTNLHINILHIFHDCKTGHRGQHHHCGSTHSKAKGLRCGPSVLLSSGRAGAGMVECHVEVVRPTKVEYVN